MDCDRHGCQMHGKRYTWTQLQGWHCTECDGAAVHRSERDPETESITDWIECGRCGGRELRHPGEAREEMVDAVLILEGLPMELRQQVEVARRKRRNEPALSLDEITKLLY
jgi:hypothetical protein